MAKARPPATATGFALFALEPVPRVLSLFSPQQYAAPLVVSPHVCVLPTLTAANASPPATTTGGDLSFVAPFPSWPRSLFPQQYAAPLAANPQPCQPPALTVTEAAATPEMIEVLDAAVPNASAADGTVAAAGVGGLAGVPD
ncbi:MAG TPA: hypothetical protein VHE78_17440 [Gemmatimonadaceae bacterium]|nr:hypothetical protein [Gemmatimonadaceae bacterium]